MRSTPRFPAIVSLASLAVLLAVTPLSAQMRPGLTPVGAEKAANADGVDRATRSKLRSRT